MPTLLGLFCEVNAGVLAASYGMLSVHEFTALLDVAYADDRRNVTAVEQYMHGFLGRAPMVATMRLTVLHWDQAQAALEWAAAWIGGSNPSAAVSRSCRTRVLMGMGAVGALYLEELARCRRTTHAGPYLNARLHLDVAEPTTSV